MTSSHSVLGHVDDEAVAEDAGVVDEDVEPAEHLDRRRDELPRAVPVGDVAAVGDRLPAGGADLGGDLLGAGSASPPPPSTVVDDDTGTLPGERQRMGAPQPPPRPGDDRHPPVQRSHCATRNGSRFRAATEAARSSGECGGRASGRSLRRTTGSSSIETSTPR